MFFKLQELTVRRGIADKPVADPGERNFWNQRRRLQALRNRGSLPGPARGVVELVELVERRIAH